MYIVGVDPSINSTGLYVMGLDEKTLDVDYYEHRGFTQVKKNESADIIYFKKKEFENNIEQYNWMKEEIFNFIACADYVAIEGYSYNSTGKIFDMAEFIGCLKYHLYVSNIPIRIYEPAVVKMYATGNGNCDKIRMCDEYDKLKDGQTDLSHLPQYKNPKEDIVDAYYLCKLLRLELMLRKGLVTLDKLNEDEIKIFNRCTQKFPINLLARSFING